MTPRHRSTHMISTVHVCTVQKKLALARFWCGRAREFLFFWSRLICQGLSEKTLRRVKHGCEKNWENVTEAVAKRSLQIC